MNTETRVIVLPNLGFGMEEGRVVAWLKQPGDPVKKGEPVAEVESDKTNVELEATADGVLAEIVVPAGEMAQVGGVLARLLPEGVEWSQPAASAPPVRAGSAEVEQRVARVSPVAQRLAREHGIDAALLEGSGPGGRVTTGDVRARLAPPLTDSQGRAQAAPAVRQYARDRGVDIQQVTATGKHGRVTRADIDTALKTAAAVPQAVTPAHGATSDEWVEVPLSPMRQRIARRLQESAQMAPHFYTTTELDLTDALPQLPAGTGINALLMYLVVRALRVMPDLNATFDGQQLRQWTPVHLAVAVALPEGLITPVIRHADDLSLTGLAARARDVVARAREGRLKPDELQDGTFTVSNLGVVEHVEQFTAILNPPQVGILAVGAAKDRPVVRHGGLHIRRTVFATLSADHRVIDGMKAARFLEALQGELARFGG